MATQLFPQEQYAVCGIYKITNKQNQKVYIGQSINIQQRFYHHRKLTNDNNYFHRALKKYGKDNFNYEIIEKCSQEQLDEREKYWIAFYQSNLREYGYNSTFGGEGKSPQCIFQYSSQGILLNCFNSITTAAQITGIPASNISAAANPNITYRKSAGGFQWRYQKLEQIDEYTFNQQQHLKKIHKTNQTRNNQGGRPSKQQVVQEWKKNNPERTKADCIKETGLSKTTVYKHW